MDNLEKAALPSTEEDERRKLLSFVICGGGPTGVEFASELWEMVNEDVISCEWAFPFAFTRAHDCFYDGVHGADCPSLTLACSRADMPGLLRDEIKVHLIQSRDHILNTYAEKISEYAEVRFRSLCVVEGTGRDGTLRDEEKADLLRLTALLRYVLLHITDFADAQERFRRHEIDMILNARVKEVTPQKVVYTIKDPKTGKTTEHEVDSGFTLWSTGIGESVVGKREMAVSLAQ